MCYGGSMPDLFDDVPLTFQPVFRQDQPDFLKEQVDFSEQAKIMTNEKSAAWFSEKTFDERSLVENHASIEKTATEVEDQGSSLRTKPYPCKFCSRVFFGHRQLGGHMSKSHKDQKGQKRKNKKTKKSDVTKLIKKKEAKKALVERQLKAVEKIRESLYYADDSEFEE